MSARLPRSNRYWLLALLALAGYMLLALWMPLQPYIGQMPAPDISTFAPWPWTALAYALLQIGLFGLYILAYRTILHEPGRPKLLSVLLPALLFGSVLLWAFPFNATDVFGYWIYGRITAVYGANVYAVPPSSFPADPTLGVIGEWVTETSPYGPVWESISAGLTLAGGSNMHAGLLLFKGLGLLLHLAASILIWLLLPGNDARQRAGRTLLWAWNPALLLTFAANGHNDGLVLLWLLLGLLLLKKGRPTLGLALMILAPLTKLSGLLPIPFFALAALRALPSWPKRARMILTVTLAWVVIVGLAFLPFGSPVELASRLLREASQGGGFSATSLMVLAARRFGLPALGDGLLDLAQMLFVAWTGWLLWQTWRGRPPERGAADVNVGYLLQAFRFRIWYASWVFPWLLLDTDYSDGDKEQEEVLENSALPSERKPAPRQSRFLLDQPRFRLRAGLWFLLTTQLSVLIYGPFQRSILAMDHLWAHLLGVPFTFGLPLVLAAWQEQRDRGRSVQ